MRHVRKSGEYRKDRRFRSQLYPVTNHAGTLCGSEPTRDDIDRKTLAHCEAYASVTPEWLADVCDQCRAKAPERKHERFCARPTDHDGHCHDGLA